MPRPRMVHGSPSGLNSFNEKDLQMALGGKFLIELAELDAMSDAKASRIKEFISRQVEEFRPPFGREIQIVPRTCVFVGTTNDLAPLTDDTGNRRFWPLEVVAVDVDAIIRDRDQIWAEAVKLFYEGTQHWIDKGTQLWDLAKARAERYRSLTMSDQLVAEFLDRVENTTTTVEVHKAVFLGSPTTKTNSRTINDAARALGWHVAASNGTNRIKRTEKCAPQ